MLSRQVDINQPLDVLLRQVNSALKGWCAYFQSGVSRATLDYVSHRAWQRVIGWLRRKHRRSTWKDLRRRYCAGGWWPAGEKASLFDPAAVRIKRYRYRGDTGIPSPWPSTR
jgi:RNA-directed DNA polymerase